MSDQVNFDLGFSLDEDSNEGHFDSKTEKEKEELMQDRHKNNTKHATKNCVKIFTDYLHEKKLKQFHKLTDDDLPDILLDFYSNLRKVNGGDYKLQTLKCIRAGINRCTKEQRGLDIISDERFKKTNEMFKAVTTRARKEGRGSTKNTPPIEPEDLPLITQYLQHDVMNNPDPKKVQQCVLFNIIYYFCRRGRQNIYDFKIDTFQIDCDPDGTHFVFQAIDEQDKNHGIYDDQPANDGRMYKQPGN